MAKRIVRYVTVILMLTVVWVILNERIDPATIAIGAAASLVAVLATNRLVLKGSYVRRYHLRPLRMLHYGVRLVGAIYVAGFQAIARMITGGIRAGIVEIETDLRDEFAISLLANSITLTPGTVTVDREGRRLKVVWLDCWTQDPDLAGREIKGPFERLLEEAVR